MAFKPCAAKNHPDRRAGAARRAYAGAFGHPVLGSPPFHRHACDPEKRMPNIGVPELIVVLVIALLVLGPGKLPEVGASLGKSIREFRKATTDLEDTGQHQSAPAEPPCEPAVRVERAVGHRSHGASACRDGHSADRAPHDGTGSGPGGPRQRGQRRDAAGHSSRSGRAVALTDLQRYQSPSARTMTLSPGAKVIERDFGGLSTTPWARLASAAAAESR